MMALGDVTTEQLETSFDYIMRNIMVKPGLGIEEMLEGLLYHAKQSVYWREEAAKWTELTLSAPSGSAIVVEVFRGLSEQGLIRETT